eukprot:scaffold18646_cov65-Phaeocystis_antarctica.AAC.1
MVYDCFPPGTQRSHSTISHSTTRPHRLAQHYNRGGRRPDALFCAGRAQTTTLCMPHIGCS